MHAVYWWREQTYRRRNIKQSRSLFNGDGGHICCPGCTHDIASCTFNISRMCMSWRPSVVFHENLNLLRPHHTPPSGDACQTVVNLFSHIWIYGEFSPWASPWGVADETTKTAIMSISGRWRYHSQLQSAPHVFMFAGFSISFPNYMSAASEMWKLENSKSRSFVWGAFSPSLAR